VIGFFELQLLLFPRVHRAVGIQIGLHTLKNRVLSKHVLKPIPGNDHNPLLTPVRKNGLHEEGPTCAGFVDPGNAGTNPAILFGSMTEIFLVVLS
jgi:hypothetical protein